MTDRAEPDHVPEPSPAAGPGAAPAPPADRGRAVGATIARNAVFTVAGRMVFLVAWALVTPYMLRVLGEERFAIWALFFALNGYFATFDFGIAQALVKFVAEFSTRGDHRSLRGVMTLGAAAYAALTLPVVVALAVFQAPILDAIHTPPALWNEAGFSLVGMAVALAAGNLVGVLTAVLNGLQRMDVTNRIQLGVTLAQIAAVIGVLAAGWGLRGLVLVSALSAVLLGVLSWRALRRIAPEARFEWAAVDRGMPALLFRFSAALQITNLGTFLQFQLDKFLLAHYWALAAVTPFELAYRLAFAAWAVPLLVLPPLVPAVSQLGSLDDRARIQRLYRFGSRWLAAIAFPLAAFSAVSAPALMTLWLGPGHEAAARYLAVMMGFLLLTIMTGVGTAVCRGIGEPWIEARYHLIGTVLHCGLSLWLVPRAPLAGVAAALAGSGLLSVAWFLWRFHRRIGEPTGAWLRGSLLIPAVASAGALAVVLALAGGWPASPATRLEALAAIGRHAAVFLGVVGVGYATSRFVTPGELLALRRGAPAA